MTRRIVLGLTLVMAAVATAPNVGHTAVHIGIDLPGPPALVVVPSTPVMYAPSVHANYFFYDHRYWVFEHGGWYVGRRFNGPWAVVAPGRLPSPILAVPVGYYRVRPAAWKHAKHGAPPPWAPAWGRRGERGRGEGRDDDRGERHEGRGEGHGRGHNK